MEKTNVQKIKGVLKMKNNKKKSLPLLLLALLMISVGAYGTRAYFSDSKEQTGDIQIELGSVNVEFTSEKWIYTGNNPDIEVNKAKIAPNSQIELKSTVNNARPGDTFTRKFTLKNTGTLTQKVVIQNTFNTDDKRYNLTVNPTGTPIVTNPPKFHELTLAPGQKAEAVLTFTVSKELKQTSLVEANANTIDFLQEVINVNATQTNNQNAVDSWVR